MRSIGCHTSMRRRGRIAGTIGNYHVKIFYKNKSHVFGYFIQNLYIGLIFRSVFLLSCVTMIYLLFSLSTSFAVTESMV